MTVYAVTWNLNRARSNYDQARRVFLDHLGRYPNIGEGDLDSVRWVQSPGSAQQLNDDLRQKLDANDRLFVVRLYEGQYEGILNKAIWEWIRPRL